MRELEDLLLQLRHIEGEIQQLECVRRVIWERAQEVYERDGYDKNFLIDYVKLQNGYDTFMDKLGDSLTESEDSSDTDN